MAFSCQCDEEEEDLHNGNRKLLGLLKESAEIKIIALCLNSLVSCFCWKNQNLICNAKSELNYQRIKSSPKLSHSIFFSLVIKTKEISVSVRRTFNFLSSFLLSRFWLSRPIKKEVAWIERIDKRKTFWWRENWKISMQALGFVRFKKFWKLPQYKHFDGGCRTSFLLSADWLRSLNFCCLTFLWFLR